MLVVDLVLSFAQVFVLAAAADSGPACNSRGLGQTACLAERLCECVYDRGGSVTGVPAGFRWDCGILRPRCGDAASPPTSVIEYRGQPPAMPLAVGIDRSGPNVIPNRD